MSRVLPFLVFLAIALSLIGGMHYYVWARLIRDTHLPPTAARLFTLLIVVLGISMPLALIASRFFSSAAVRPAVWVARARPLETPVGETPVGPRPVRVAPEEEVEESAPPPGCSPQSANRST